MRVSREQAALNRGRIIDVASKLFRERGFDGVGVADLMKAAGLTHGGFYGNFASKEDLIEQACSRALQKSQDILNQTVELGGKDALGAIAERYLSTTHRDHPGEGCVIAALGTEVARNSSPVRAAFTKAIRSAIEVLSTLIPTKSKRLKRERALAVYSSLVGALVLARAVDDQELSTEILEATLASIHSLHPSSNAE
ncbi:TetR/AcrR family transcriptional regulator [Pirellula sp. SH-Sr6A]|uniref:TetR/AcrR family transcriptional regulator n=1 Tax=Pirellula sp. SH-Sr6A TaxID=1632865 RepID=UPI0011BA4EE2|nr:TetR/AcrR family transcriptional regulator [Pirellula sp. SH-Sr6A]